MTIASEITRIQNNIAAAYTAASGKGATLPATENSDNLATCIGSIPSGGGTPTGTTDVPLTRFKDDTNTEIGTYYMNFEDANGNSFKVILLDAQYRATDKKWCSVNNTAIPNMPSYSDLDSSNIWEAKETATENTQLIIDYVNSTGGTATTASCSHCRSQSFIINGTTYYGQLPNMIELLYVGRHYSEFDTLDTSASTSTSTNFSNGLAMLSSSQYSSGTCWQLSTAGNASSLGKNVNSFACPVLEIPNT